MYSDTQSHQRLPASEAEAEVLGEAEGKRRSDDGCGDYERMSSTSDTLYSGAAGPAHRRRSSSVSSLGDSRFSMEELGGRQELHDSPPQRSNKASMVSSFFNLTNAIVGAGVIGLPYAMRSAGIAVGVLMIVVLSCVVDWTLRVLAVNSKLCGQSTYQGLVAHCFGRVGLAANSVFQFAMAFGGMASFIVIVGDTLPHVLGALMPGIADSAFGRVAFSRRFVVAFFVCFLAYPLSLYRDIGALGKTSAFAVMAMCTIVVAVIVEGPRIPSELRADDGAPVELANAGVFQAVGVITFAFVCHHNSFMIYGSLKKPTLNRYFEVVHLSTAISCIASLIMAVSGYLLFGAKTQGNVLNNFPEDNLLINIARFLFALNMITTFPMETLVAREVVDELAFPGRPFGMKRHVIITTVLCGAGLAIGESVCNLGVLLELTGGLSASFLAFILPSACYLRLTSKPLTSWRVMHHWACIAFGVTVMVLSAVLSIKRAVSSKSDSYVSCWR